MADNTGIGTKGIDRLLVAAPSSGSGKTLFTCGLLRLLKEEGRDPASFKCGPDFIDPMFHRDVLGIEGSNIDPFFSDRSEMRRLLSACGKKTAVLEGAMGIYDGIAGGHKRGSCYEVAAATDTPVVLIADAKGMGSTLLSVIKGILSDDDANLIRGIVLNRISPHYYGVLRPMLSDLLEEIGGKRGTGCSLLGGIPESRDVTLGTRHLGLVMPDEYEDLAFKITAFRELIRSHLDTDRLLEIMAGAGEPEPSSGGAGYGSARGLRLAVSRDEAFCFCYRENLEEFLRHGIEPVFFSPLRDSALPKDVSGLLLTGGYPELHAEALSENRAMLQAVREAIGSGMPSLAECGGFLYLLDGLITADGHGRRMAAVVPGSAQDTGRLGRFGYITVSGRTENSLLTGLSIKGHEFHYFDSSNNGSDAAAVKPGSGREWECIHAGKNHVWGFPHLYYPSCPALIERFAQEMDTYRSSRNGSFI